MLDSRLVLVTEYMEGGNLTQNLAAKKVNWYRKGKKVCAHAPCDAHVQCGASGASSGLIATTSCILLCTR